MSSIFIYLFLIDLEVRKTSVLSQERGILFTHSTNVAHGQQLCLDALEPLLAPVFEL